MYSISEINLNWSAFISTNESGFRVIWSPTLHLFVLVDSSDIRALHFGLLIFHIFLLCSWPFIVPSSSQVFTSLYGYDEDAEGGVNLVEMPGCVY